MGTTKGEDLFLNPIFIPFLGLEKLNVRTLYLLASTFFLISQHPLVYQQEKRECEQTSGNWVGPALGLWSHPNYSRWSNVNFEMEQ